jgi:hypothetical protein
MYKDIVKQRLAVKKAVRKRLVLVDSLKTGKCCEDCKIEYPPFVMDWHHIDPTQKSFGIGQGRVRHSIKKILEEIAKCVLLCSNCHRIREYKDFVRKVL